MNPKIRVAVEVIWDADSDSVDDDRMIRAEVEYPNDSKAVLPDTVARKLAEFISAMSLPVGTGPQPSAKVPDVTVGGSATDAEIADAIRRQQAQKGSVSRGVL